MFVKGGVEGNTIGSSSTGSSSSSARRRGGVAGGRLQLVRAIKAELRPHTDGLKVKVLRKAVLAAYARRRGRAARRRSA